MQKELRQTKPFASPEQEASLALLRTADLLHRSFAQLAEPHGITAQQYNVLRILRGAGEPGLPTLEIAERMIERAPGITRLLDRLEAKSLVRRVRCPRDRRRVLVHIRARGLALLAKLDAPVAALDRSSLGGLGRRDALELIRLLDAVRAGHALAQPSDPRPRRSIKEKRA
jgi:DNA-binding MarR family transcriptional regulator